MTHVPSSLISRTLCTFVLSAGLSPLCSAAVVYSTDFESGAGSEWSRTTTDVTPIGARRFLGQFGNDVTTLTLTDLPPHTSVSVSFKLFVIRSWDGNYTGPTPGLGPDLWDLRIQNGPRLLHTSFHNGKVVTTPAGQAYPEDYPLGSHPALTGASEIYTLGFIRTADEGVLDSVYDLTRSFASTSSTVVLQFSASGLQPLADESWGLDDVVVTIDDPIVSTNGCVVYSSGFQGAVGSEWSRTSRDFTPQGARSFLGQFNNDTATLTVNSLPPHRSIGVSFELFVILTWDGNYSGPTAGIGPDRWTLGSGGGPVLLDTTFSNNMDFTGFAGQAYPDNYPSGQHAALTGASEVGSLGYIRTAQEGNKDSVYDLSFSFPHSDNTLKLNFSALGLQPIADESWGLDNVVVTAADPTWPPGEVQNLVATGVDSVTENISFTYNNGTCNAANNNIYYGPLTHADLAAYNYTGAVCGIGNSGVYDSFNPGTGSFFFVVVGNDGSNTEGSYGTNLNSDTGTRTERPPFAPNACTVVQSLTNRCDCY